MTLSPEHELIIGRGVSALPLSVREKAVHYIESRLRPLRSIDESAVHAATAAAIARYSE